MIGNLSLPTFPHPTGPIAILCDAPNTTEIRNRLRDASTKPPGTRLCIVVVHPNNPIVAREENPAVWSTLIEGPAEASAHSTSAGEPILVHTHEDGKQESTQCYFYGLPTYHDLLATLGFGQLAVAEIIADAKCPIAIITATKTATG